MVARACSVVRTPARDRRESTLSSGETCGANTPAGSPDAPAAGPCASSTVTCQPRRAMLAAQALPARPAPMIRQLPGAATDTSGKASRTARGSQRGLKTACRLSRFGGTPGTLWTSKPHCARSSRRVRAMVQVASRVPRWQQRATALSMWTLQSSGLTLGLKPSR
ncbi:hypothetical protein SDC9_189153 [bioreactor metagenome]|uniref:Uncharacterized protein n=1 Tax=bioreactor metagenome TaxID=1076179 RepID=A0A645HTS3_9ZZZZ